RNQGDGPQLTIKIPRYPHTSRPFGRFLIPSIFELDRPSKKGGVIVQHIQRRIFVWDGRGNPVKDPYGIKGGDLDYWEMWVVPANAAAGEDCQRYRTPAGVSLSAYDWIRWQTPETWALPFSVGPANDFYAEGRLPRGGGDVVENSKGLVMMVGT